MKLLETAHTAHDVGFGVVGWREWVELPALSTLPIKAKVDTGARTSALHAHGLELVRNGATLVARFELLPEQGSNQGSSVVEVPVVDQRFVRSSNGVEELRPVIQTHVTLGAHLWEVELTLTDREPMGFRMLIGRTALRNRFLIDPNRSYCLGR